MLGARHDVQIWAPDERAPPPPRASVVGAVASMVWVQQALEPLRARVPALKGAELSVTDVAETHALLFCTAAGGALKELVLLRQPPTLHVYGVAEHGRQFFRALGWCKMASTLSDDTAPSARLVPPGARAAPTHPGAPPGQLGSLRWPRLARLRLAQR